MGSRSTTRSTSWCPPTAAATGTIEWQTADPFSAQDMGPPSVANGVVYVCSFDPQGHMFALNAGSGQILFSFASGGSCGGLMMVFVRAPAPFNNARLTASKLNA